MLDALSDPSAIVSWSPVRFEVLELDGLRLYAGSRARVRGAVAGRELVFDVRILKATSNRFSLIASGPIEIAARYEVAEEGLGSRVLATIGIAGRGWTGGLLARAAEALLRGGALDSALARIGRQLEAHDQFAYA